eukprot:gene9442-6625_t
MEDKQTFFVENVPDGRRFKMVIRGDLRKLSALKIRRYLSNFGMSDDCVLSYRGVDVTNEMLGRDFGLVANAVLQLRPRQEPPRPAPAPRAAPFQDEEASEDEEDAPSGDDAAPQQTRRGSPQPAPAVERTGLREWAPPSAAGRQRLQHENRQLQRELEQLRLQVQRRQQGSGATPRSLEAIATRNLEMLADVMQTDVEWNADWTCCVRVTGQIVLHLAFDMPSERVLLSGEVASALPADRPTREKLYEILLQGSLMGTAAGGGALGVQLGGPGEERVVLTATVMMKYAADDVLVSVVPPFLSALRQWRALLRELY